MQLLNHTKRMKIVFTKPAVDHISARKAGGSGIATNAAAWEWFLLESEGDDVSELDYDGILWDQVKGAEYIPSSYPATVGEEYRDIYEQIIADLFEAERLAIPEDFPPATYDMGAPHGFVQHLWRILHEHER